MGILSYRGKRFYMDDEPYTVLSGAMHYFRIPRAYWYDRLLKLKECGFNTVETYTCWNLHEPREGTFDFSDGLDVVAFVDTAAELGLHVILRPGPYICAEWEFGGLPAWLLTCEGMELRCSDEMFLQKVRSYYTQLLGRLRSRFAANGGNIVMLQVENEYGSYGDDHAYMRGVLDIYRDLGIDCLFFTSDGATYTMLSGGSLEECLCVANFGSGVAENLAVLEAYRPNQPLMCGEFWCGWFDHWFEEHHVRPAEELTQCFQAFMDAGASVNFYMFHGGTNFGFMNGANYDGVYSPTVTSYDYNAPLNEAGDRTAAYYSLRDMVASYGYPVPPLTARDSEKAAYGVVTMEEYAGLLSVADTLTAPVACAACPYMEDVGQAYGYILYRTVLRGPREDWPLFIEEVHDRAQIFINGEHRSTVERWRRDPSGFAGISIPLKEDEEARLEILVENMGRVNYGAKLRDRKGIHGVRFHGQYHFGWEVLPLPMQDLSQLPFCGIAQEKLPLVGPVFLRGQLKIEDEPRDTFLRLDGFTKGFVTVNGRCIGRYFNPAGPQKTLYVPAPFLRRGGNEILIFESDVTHTLQIRFTATPDLG